MERGGRRTREEGAGRERERGGKTGRKWEETIRK